MGLEAVADKRVGAFSLGMGQRLGIAAALLGDPGVLLLDEPVNGLDPEGIRWIRTLLQRLAAEGRTVFVSSHLMSEMALTATELIVVGRGRLVASGTVAELTRSQAGSVLVRTDESAALSKALKEAGASVVETSSGEMTVSGATSRDVGRIAADHGIALIELTPQSATLEEAFMEITRDDVEFHANTDPVAAS